MKKVLIIGKDSYLGGDLSFNDEFFDVKKVARHYEISDPEEFNSFDYIINFCIQPEHFTKELTENEMIDVEIAKRITNPKTKFVFMSSRKVYGSNHELKIYSENSELKPYDFYSINKAAIERKLYNLLGENLLILRTGNIIGPLKENKNTTFLSWLKTEMDTKGKVICNIDKNVKKDFITKKYFQEALITLVENDCSGIYNIGANFAFTTEELLLKILPPALVEFDNNSTTGEQFILNCSKLHGVIRSFTKEEFNDECKKLSEALLCVSVNH